MGLQVGKDVTAPPDRVEAYKWFQLLAKARHPGADQHRDILARSLSAAERARAEAAAQAWRATFLARPDVGPRGERRLGP